MNRRFDSLGNQASGALRVGRVIAFIAALWLLNALLTFHNIWPTVFIRPAGEFSIELAGILLLMAAWLQARNKVPRWILAVLAVLFVLGALGRYAEVTAPALYGREVNIYWDLPHLSSVAAMLTRVAAPWLLAVSAVAIVAGLATLYFAALWSWRRVAGALETSVVRAVVSVAAIAVIVGFTLENRAEVRPRIPRFSMPIGKTYGQQFVKVGAALLERGTVRQLPPTPPLSSTLSLIQGRDVLIVFVESYGRVAYDNRDFFETLAPARAELAAAASDTGRGVVSGYVESPTFGGGSWLAHLSFLTGIEMRDAGQAQLLMTQSRRNFGDAMAEHGYRRVALMPGLKMPWPEGVFYNFDQIYDDASLQYRGPAFGWWRIPDQFSLAKLDELELTPRTGAADDRKPLFVFFPTITTHTPFRPTPPYQSDWSRLLGEQPFDEAPLQQSLSQLPEWSNLAPGYTDSVAYTLQTLAGYLRTQARDDLIVVIVGDHQPPAMVSGVGASWNVPVHVIASQQPLLDSFGQCGFVSGLIPGPQALGSMHRLGPTLLHAFEATANPTGCLLREGNASMEHHHRERT